MQIPHLEHDLFLLLLHLSQVTGEGRIKSLFIDSMNSLSEDFQLCFVEKQDEAIGEPIEIATLQNSFGSIDMQSNSEQIDESTKALVRNSVRMLALFLEKQLHDRLLSDEKLLLNDLVAKQTRNLKIANEDLKKEIEERKNITRELQENRFFIQKILDTTPNIIYIYDLLEQKNIFANKEITAFLGYDRQQIQALGSKVMEQIIHPEDLPLVLKHHGDLRTTLDNQMRELFYRIKHMDGSWRWLYSRDLPFSRSSDGNVNRILGIAEDVTEKKETEKIRLKLEEQLRQSQKMEAIGTLAGGIAHDFNNILGIVLGNAELAIDDIPKWNPVSQNLEKIKKASLRAKGIVQQLLGFTRKTAQEKSVLKIQNLVKETIGLLRATIPTSVELKTEIQHDAGPIEADPTQIHQILINLCTNAAHAIDATGILEIMVSEIELDTPSIIVNNELSSGSYIKLTVSDNGTGIPHDIQDKVFDPYFTTKEVGKGTGMGLAVVHGIVKNHDGAISIYSEPGKGTSVNVFFPKANSLQKESIGFPTEIPKGKETILFVDDEASLALLGKHILTRLGYEVITCVDPKEALNIFVSDPKRFDLIITDMTMPGMTGEQLAKKALEIKPAIPILLCTGFNTKITEALAEKIGIGGYLEKPFDMKLLATTVRNIIDTFKNR
jgi:PAS domain S-box-containing protein